MTSNNRRILLIGPLSPPSVGPTVAFELFRNETRKYVDVKTVDICAHQLKKETRWFAWSTWLHGIRVLVDLVRRLPGQQCCVIVFCSYGFLNTIGVLIIAYCKLIHTPCYVRPFAGSLHHYYENRPRVARLALTYALRNARGVFVQTKAIYDYFKPMLGEAVHYFPNCRRSDEPMPPARETAQAIDVGPLKLLFAGAIRSDKGVFTLLDSLAAINSNPESPTQLVCDFVGPIHADDKENFLKRIRQTSNAYYKGVVSHHEMVRTMCNYDVLVLPTYHAGEGHPGVLIEAMFAGITAVASSHASISDLITDGENGLLVPPQNVSKLTVAILTLADNRDLLRRLSANNYSLRRKYDCANLVPEILQLCGITDI